MGGGDLNAKKAWHPNTLKNQERVWKAEQAAAEEKKRIAELERERHLERERSELNKLAKSNLTHSGLSGDDRLHWMYEKPDKKVQQEEYLLGKAIDKNHEQAGKSAADDIPAISRRVIGSSMLTVAGDTQVDLVRKMREDPLLLVKERERAARAALLNNPVQRAKLAELLRKEQINKNENKSIKKKKKSKDLDNILAEKLQALSGKKGIDLASLLASDDSSSESSDEQSKKKKKKKKSKTKNVVSGNNNVKKHKSKRVNKQKKDSIENDSEHAKRKERRRFIENESAKSYNRRHRRYSSADNRSSDDNSSGKLNSNLKYISKNESKTYNNLDQSKWTTIKCDIVESKRKKRHHSSEKDLTKVNVKKHRGNSTEDHQSNDQQSTDDELNKSYKNHAKEKRYWNYKQYSTVHQRTDNKHARSDRQSKKEKHSGDNRYKYDREGRQRADGFYTERNDLQDNNENKKEKDRIGSNALEFDKGWRNTKGTPVKGSRLSEAEKASKLAEMIAAGAEREKQRERRVAHQLAEKETEDRPNTHSRSRNVVHQLPDSLESRIHSNRHYIQRDQRHMNENFARR